MFEECIRCGEYPAADEFGYCGHCHWMVQAEVVEGFYEIRDFLKAHALFADWCQAHGLPAS